MKIFELGEIKEAINLTRDLEDLINSQKGAFRDFARGLYDVPLPMQFIIPEYHSDCHIKAGYRQSSKNLVIKIANGTPLGGNGIILIFACDTGELKAMLRDGGFLTTLRTAIAGIAISELIPWNIEKIGIMGSGHLAKMLFEIVQLKYPEKPLMLYSRDPSKAKKITDHVYIHAEELIENCDLIFTATSSESPIINDMDTAFNKAIIALGSDDEYKRELSLEIFGKSDFVIVDSKNQALKFGDVAKAITSGIISSHSLMEFGHVIETGIPRNTRTIIADFSGIAPQDVAMSEFILSRLV